MFDMTVVLSSIESARARRPFRPRIEEARKQAFDLDGTGAGLVTSDLS